MSMPFIKGSQKPQFFSFLLMIGTLFSAIAFGYLVAAQNLTIVLLGLFLPVGILLLTRPHLAAGLFFVSVFLPINYIQRYFFSLPAILVWLPHILLALTVISIFLTKKNQISVSKSLPLSYGLAGLAWVTASIFSSVANAQTNSLLTTLLSLRHLFLLFGGIFVFRVLFSAQNQQEKIIKRILIMGIAMLPVTLFQRFYFVMRLDMGSGDMVTGLFAGYPQLVFFQLFCILAVIGWWMQKQNLLPFHPLITIILLYSSLIVSNSKAAIFYFAASVLFLIGLNRKRISLKFLVAFIVMGILAIASVFVFEQIYFQDYGRSAIDRFYNLEGAANYLFYESPDPQGTLQRGSAVVFVFNLINEKLETLLFGFGPGALGDSRLAGGAGHIYLAYPNMNLDYSQLSTTLGELGLAGYLAITMLLFAIYSLNRRKESRQILSTRKSTVFLLFLYLIYTNILTFPVTALIIGVLSIQIPDQNNQADIRLEK